MATFAQKRGMSPSEIASQARAALPLRSPSVESAAQKVAAFLYQAFSPSVALARVYAIAPLHTLDDPGYAFCRALAAAKVVSLRADTPVLSLLGTAGDKTAWNDRKLSAGHLAIPLASTSFVMTIPMIARLVLEMGGDLRLFDRTTAPLSAVASGRRLSLTGVFHVLEAATALDSEDRLIIPAVKFIADERVRSVFAVGTTCADGTVLIALVFAREMVDRSYAIRFGAVIDAMKTSAASALNLGRIFSDVGSLAPKHAAR